MDPLVELIGQAQSIVELRAQIRQLLTKVAQSRRRLPPILLQGETGTGKGLVADVIHRAGPRGEKPFVDVNCAAIPETLLEAELFGFERGAFTDARQAKAGLLQSAEGGTILLDEIAMLSDALQAKLLKVIETRSVRRLGSTRNEPVDISIVAATNEDLLAAVQARRFREDLYHRLAVLTLHLPPLRERRDDIPALAEHFLTRACADYGLPPKTLTPTASAALLAYRWPGNVRELANVMERAALLTSAQHMTVQMLGLPSATTPVGVGGALPAQPAGSLDVRIETWERQELVRALEETGWNVSRAAVRLGISRNTIRYRIARYDLHPPAERTRPHQTARVPRVRTPVAAALPPRPGSDGWSRCCGPPSTHSTRVIPRRSSLATATSLCRRWRALPDASKRWDGWASWPRSGSSRPKTRPDARPWPPWPSRTRWRASVRPRPDGLRSPSASMPRNAWWARWTDTLSSAPTPSTTWRRCSRTLVYAPRRTAFWSARRPDRFSTAASISRRSRPGTNGPGSGTGCSATIRSASVSEVPWTVCRPRTELGALRSRWQSALHERGQIVALVGEAGVGESRLLFEFRQTLNAETLTYLEGRGESYGGGRYICRSLVSSRGTFASTKATIRRRSRRR